MPDQPVLALTDQCPEPDCAVAIGVKHRIDCYTAICVSTGHQRILHAEDPPPPPADMPIDADVHICGEDVWTGLPHGAIEAAAYGLFVRPATAGDPSKGWIPCTPDEPGAVPDLDRLIRSGRWNPIRQIWEIEKATRRS